MKITFISHAAILIETRGVRILSDPWWRGPCFGVQWWLQSEPFLEALEDAPPDFIYISHDHSDHLHPGTLRRLPRSARVLASAATGIKDQIAALGFGTIELEPRTAREIAPGLKVEITPTWFTDTFMVLDDGEKVCVNLNDAVHSAADEDRKRVLDDIRARYPKIDYVFCGYGTASYFPNCYFFPGKDDCATAERRQAHFVRAWASTIHELRPRFGFPFAASVVFLDDALFWLNEPLHNALRPVDVYHAAYPGDATEVHDIAPGFAIENKEVLRNALFEPVSRSDLARRTQDIWRANAAAPAQKRDIESLVDLLRRNVDLARDYLREFEGDYRVLIRLRGSDSGIELRKDGDSISVGAVVVGAENDGYDVVFSTRFAYLRRALTSPLGHEVLIVGSGGTFTMRDRHAARAGIHLELQVLLRQIGRPPPSRFGDQPRWLYTLKVGVKRVLGRNPNNSYNLSDWVVMAAPSASSPAGVRARSSDG